MASEYTAGKEKGSQSSAILGLFFQSFSVKSSHMELHPISENVCFEGSLGVRLVHPTFYLIAWNTERGDGLISLRIFTQIQSKNPHFTFGLFWMSSWDIIWNFIHWL